MNLFIIQPSIDSISETFFRAQSQLLPFNNTIVYYDEEGFPCVESERIIDDSFLPKLRRKFFREAMGKDYKWEMERELGRFFRGKADVVLAQYGTTAVRVLGACKKAGVPLVAHFHGFDASKYDVLDKNKQQYVELFNYASAIVAVSNKMKSTLVELGASPDKIHVNPCGVDPEAFKLSMPEKAGPIFLSVGRFVEKKAPYLTILSFAKILKIYPDARLEMVGDGPLLGVCKDLVVALGVKHAVVFHGSQNHNFVMSRMQEVRCFVQHSVQASDGDCEGMPVSIMEAMASGLPVVSTLHAGIPDTVLHGETGYLVEEKDVDSMANYMMQFLETPSLAKSFGYEGREIVLSRYSNDISVSRLAKIINANTLNLQD